MATKRFSFNQTPQTRPLPGQTQNNAGGFSFTVDKWKRLERFLILGSDKGTYYVKECELTFDNAKSVLECIKEDPQRVLNTVSDISEGGRAPKNDQALFVLAILTAKAPHLLKNFDITRVARIGTHIFDLCGMVEKQGLRRWGRSLRSFIGKWYMQDPDNLIYQVIKYRQRNGWTHTDVMRLSHPKPTTETQEMIFQWVTKGETQNARYAGSKIHEFDMLQRSTSESEVIDIITRSHLPWECVPTNFLKSANVWKALLPNLPLTALVRNLGRLSAIGAFGGDSELEETVYSRLTSEEYIRKSRLHPLSILLALKTYNSGQGDKGKLTWGPHKSICNALDKAFYLAFRTITPTEKRILLALDVSSSMRGNMIAGMNIYAREGSAAMAMITKRTELEAKIMAFSHQFVPFPIEDDDKLTEVIWKADSIGFGSTDCALPMIYALKNRMLMDAFIVYTDSETWAGIIHPVQALKEYRDWSGINSKLVVVGMTSTEFTIGDPNDLGCMDVVGFDTSAPAVINDFIRSE